MIRYRQSTGAAFDRCTFEGCGDARWGGDVADFFDDCVNLFPNVHVRGLNGVFDERTELAVVYQVPLDSVKYSVWMACESAKFWRENRTDRNQSIMATKLRRIKLYFWIQVLAAIINIPACILLAFRGTFQDYDLGICQLLVRELLSDNKCTIDILDSIDFFRCESRTFL